MTIWILAVLLFGFFAWTGYAKGAIRVLIMLLGLIVAALAALPLAPTIKPLFPMMGMVNPYLLWILPPVTVFILVQIIFTGLAFFAHHKVAMHFKYKTDDLHRLRWERLNQRVGLSMGLGAGAVYLIVIGLVIYVSGYLTVQVSTADNASGTVQYLNTARTDLQTTGLDKLMAKVDPASPRYYESADLAGLIYRNPLLQSRLSSYPALLPLGERAEFQELAADKEFTELFQSQGNVIKVVNHPKLQAVAKNAEILQELSQIELADLRQYLETGRSPKYEDEKILGRWQLNETATLVELKKGLTNMTSSGWKVVKKVIAAASMSLIAMPDSKVIVKLPGKDAIVQLTQPAPVAAVAAPAAAAGSRAPGPGYTPRSLAARADPNSAEAQYRQRYGRPSGAQATPPPGAPAPAAPPPPPNPVMKVIVTGEGAWKHDGDKYKITVKDTKEAVLEGIVREDTLYLAKDGLRLVFERE